MARRSHRRPNVVGITMVVVIVVVAIYSLGFAAWDYLAVLAPSAGSRYRFIRPQFEFLLWDRFIEAIFGCWFFFTGSAVGSFLNVVVYRMPMGLSLVSKGSRCPYCLTPILARDNLPIIGWLGLRGRCRACRLPISPRYPIVEALTGLMFLLLFGAELVSGGRYLPNSWFPQGLDIGGVILDARWDLLAIYLYHMFFLCWLWSAALMVFDQKTPPPRFWLIAVATALVSVFAWPWLYPWLVSWAGGIAEKGVSLYPVPAWPLSGALPATERHWTTDPVAALVGASAGLISGVVLTRGVGWVKRGTRGAEVVRSLQATDSEERASRGLPPIASAEPTIEKLDRNATGEQPSPQVTLAPGTAVAGPRAIAGMLMLVGLGCGWQFLPIVVAGASLLAGATSLAKPARRAKGWSLSGFGLALATLLILLRWSWWQSVWQWFFDSLPSIT